MQRKTIIICLLMLPLLSAMAQGPNNSGTYYQNADGKKAAALKTALCGIIYNRTERSYSDLWTDFQKTDKRSDGKVWDMYSNSSNFVFGTHQDKGSGGKNEGEYYNREHSWPNSWFGGNVQPMYTDLHHIYPTDKFVNSKRSNYPLGETNGERYKSNNGFSKVGSCTYSGYTGTVFEPNDEYKGDFARTYFYMVTCYEEKLPDWYNNYSESQSTLDGNTYPGLSSWQLEMLMKWAKNDPVSEKEINRNNAVYDLQNNRNPFIDYPGLEEYIWGDKQDLAFSYDDDNSGVEVNATNFPDEAFRNWMLNNVAGASDGILTDEEIAKVKSINCSGTSSSKGNISNLKGIEFFTALTHLSCSYNQLTSLDMSKNTALTSLSCSSNQLTSLDVSKNTALTSLSCSSNQLTSLDVSNNTALTSLDCGRNQLKTLDVSYNTELNELRCHSNQLETLNVNNNTELTNLYCSSNKLTTLSIINNMKLGELRCSSNQLTTLSIGVKSLYILDCSSNQLTKLDVSYISLLQRLDCSSNQLTTLDVSNNWGLQDLSCSSNQLTKLDVSKNTALEWLKCESNQLLYLNLVTNTKISSSGTSITPQTATLTAKNVSEGIAIPVPTAFDFTKVSNLKLAGSNVNGSITTVNGQKYLVFAQAGTAQSAIDGKSLTYSYSTGNSESKAASMDVTVTLSYTETTPTGIKVNATNFPDEAFRNWVLQNVSGASDGMLTDSEIANVTSIDCSGTSSNKGNISSLQGIEFFTALTNLTCNYNQLTTLEVSQNTALTFLSCSSNQLTSLDVSTNTALTQLYCNSNQLTNLDVSQNTALTSLDCSSNQLTSLDVSKNTALTSLSCSSNKLTSLDVSGCTALTSLYCYNNQITTLDLSNNVKLRELQCQSNQLKSLNVTKNVDLNRLECYSNQLETLDVSNNPALSRLWCYSNKLTSLDLSKNTDLYILYCQDNQLLCIVFPENIFFSDELADITPQSISLKAENINGGIAIPIPSEFDITKVANPSLEGDSVSRSIDTINGQKYWRFIENGANAKSVDGKKLTYIYNLGWGYSRANSLDVTVTLSYAATTQTGIEVNSTNFPDEAFRNWVLQNINGASDGILTEEEIAKVTSIDCSGKYNAYGEMANLKGIEFFTSLKSLTCRYNKLTSLNVSKNTALTSLDCSYNQLKSFDISGCTELTSLYCIENGLTSLNVSNNMALTSLSCYDNQLTSLNLSNHTALKRVDCQYNQLTNLNVSNCSALTYLQCNTNELTNLDVSTCTALANLYCHYNQLTSLDVSSNTSLKMLYCNNNQLVSLDVSNNTALTSLACNANKLIYLDLGANNKISDSDTNITSQTTALTARGISEGVAIPVPSDFDFSKVTNLKLAGSSVTGSVATVNGQKYLVFAQLSTAQSAIHGKQLTYTYNTGNSYSKAASMDVTVTLSYTAVTYSLSIQSRSGGSVTYNGTTITNKTQSFTVNAGVSATITITPDNGYRLASLTVNGTDVTSNVKDNQYTIDNITTNTTVVATFEEIPVTTFSLSIQSGTGGSVSYNGTTITNKTQSFTVNEGTSATITISPNTGYKLSRLTVNGTNVTSSVKDNQYTISSIASNTTVVATFEQITYTLTVQATGNGTVTYNSTGTKNNTHSFTVNHGSSATLSIAPDSGYRLASLTVNGTNVTSSVSNNQYTISNITANTTVVATFEQIPATTYSLSIQSGAGGSVAFNGTTVANSTRQFTVEEGTSATITISPNSGYRLSSLTVNGTDVTSNVKDNQYTISNITGNTTVVVTFKAIPQSITQDGINYVLVSADDYTLNVGRGDYSGHVIVPTTFNYDGDTWTVAGVVDGAFNLSAITAITWNPNTAIGDGAFGTQTNPNLLLYVKAEAYAPTNVQNVIANGRAKKIILTEAASGNDFYCPQEFTAEEISYTHKYGMTTGINECRGWETIALPFDVKQFTHESKGALVPFKAYYSGSPNKPFWLYELSGGGFVEAESIEAYTPYIISMPNNDYYDSTYLLAGKVTFSATNARVGVTELKTQRSGDKTFVPAFSMQTASEDIFPLNVNNDFFMKNDYYAEGSHFVKESRNVMPFEAYMTTSANNAKGFIPIFETLPTAIREIPIQEFNGMKGVRIYSMSGELIMHDEHISIDEAMKRLKRGVYFVNGRKMVVK